MSQAPDLGADMYMPPPAAPAASGFNAKGIMDFLSSVKFGVNTGKGGFGFAGANSGPDDDIKKLIRGMIGKDGSGGGGGQGSLEEAIKMLILQNQPKVVTNQPISSPVTYDSAPAADVTWQSQPLNLMPSNMFPGSQAGQGGPMWPYNNQGPLGILG